LPETLIDDHPVASRGFRPHLWGGPTACWFCGPVHRAPPAGQTAAASAAIATSGWAMALSKSWTASTRIDDR
jgi:hypothetical protein